LQHPSIERQYSIYHLSYKELHHYINSISQGGISFAFLLIVSIFYKGEM